MLVAVLPRTYSVYKKEECPSSKCMFGSGSTKHVSSHQYYFSSFTEDRGSGMLETVIKLRQFSIYCKSFSGCGRYFKIDRF